MTPEAQQIAIAEVRGWTFDKPADIEGKHWILTPEGKIFGYLEAGLSGLPDYLNDRNAMQAPIDVLSWQQQLLFMEHLLGQMMGNPEWRQWQAINATASQRAEAFLRTIGKWTDS